jgi:hypothetical protein
MSARRWLLLPLLSPLLAVLLVAMLNPRHQLAIRLLTWTSPRAPLGLWLSAAALGGAALSGAGTALALRQGAGPKGRRRVSTRPAEPWSQWDAPVGDRWSEDGEPPAGDRHGDWDREARGDVASAMDHRAHGWRDVPVAVSPPRSPGDPAPTVAVPFRVLHRPPPPREREPAMAEAAPTPERSARAPVPESVEDDWEARPAPDEW